MHLSSVTENVTKDPTPERLEAEAWFASLEEWDREYWCEHIFEPQSGESEAVFCYKLMRQSLIRLVPDEAN